MARNFSWTSLIHAKNNDTFVVMKKPANYKWIDFNTIKEEALKYQKRSHFNKKSSGAAFAAKRNGWYDEVCSHMDNVGAYDKRLIYACEFDDNHVYIGLTCNLENRITQHLKTHKDSAVYKHVKLCRKEPAFIHISDYICVEAAIELESITLKTYQQQGWIILNKAPTGSTGGSNRKWFYGNVKDIALGYSSFTEFRKQNAAAYNFACQRGFLAEITSHMSSVHTKWNRQKCLEEAKKFNSIGKFRKESYGAFNFANKNGFLNEVMLHMVPLKRTNWTKESVLLLASDYHNLSDFRVVNESGYNFCLKNGFREELNKVWGM